MPQESFLTRCEQAIVRAIIKAADATLAREAMMLSDSYIHLVALATTAPTLISPDWHEECEVAYADLVTKIDEVISKKAS